MNPKYFVGIVDVSYIQQMEEASDLKKDNKCRGETKIYLFIVTYYQIQFHYDPFNQSMDLHYLHRFFLHLPSIIFVT